MCLIRGLCTYFGCVTQNHLYLNINATKWTQTWILCQLEPSGSNGTLGSKIGGVPSSMQVSGCQMEACATTWARVGAFGCLHCLNGSQMACIPHRMLILVALNGRTGRRGFRRALWCCTTHTTTHRLSSSNDRCFFCNSFTTKGNYWRS